MEKGEPLGPLLWRYGSRDPTRTFVLVPYAGGSTFAFAEWIPPLVAPDEAALVVRYPDARSDVDGGAEHDLARLAADAADAVVDATDGPLVLVGHSMGGLVAYEMALRLEHWSRPVRLLVVSASRPPGHPVMTVAQVLAMTGDQWRAEVLAQGLVDAEAVDTPGMLDLLVPPLRANYLMVARHRASEGRLSCPLLAINGDADTAVPAELLADWGARTRHDFTAKTFPGGHFYYRDQLSRVCQTILAVAGANDGRKPVGRAHRMSHERDSNDAGA